LAQNYESAATRHFEDATALQALGRADNAGYLIGFAAECAIKHNIVSLQPGAHSPQGHFPEILIAARKRLGPRSGYTSMFDVIRADIFSGWNVHRRYDETGHTDSADLTKWFNTTKRLFATAGLKVRR